MTIIVPAQASAAGTAPVYRMYNSRTGEHLFTTVVDEYNRNVKYGWKKEGVAWYAPASGKPIMRLYNKKTHDHHYTMSDNEVNVLTNKYGWKYEGIVCYSGGVNPVYRLYNKKLRIGSHHFTTSWKEYATLKTKGWKQEGVAFFASSVPSGSAMKYYAKYPKVINFGELYKESGYQSYNYESEDEYSVYYSTTFKYDKGKLAEAKDYANRLKFQGYKQTGNSVSTYSWSVDLEKQLNSSTVYRVSVYWGDYYGVSVGATYDWFDYD